MAPITNVDQPTLARLYTLLDTYGSVDKIPDTAFLALKGLGLTPAQGRRILKDQLSNVNNSSSWRGIAPSTTGLLDLYTNNTELAWTNRNAPVVSGGGFGQDYDKANRASTKPQPQKIDPGAVADSMKPPSAPGATNKGLGGANSLTPADYLAQNDFLSSLGNISLPGVYSAPSLPANIPLPTLMDLPTAPDPYKFKINDFSKQASEMMSSAYGPQYAAVEAAKQNVNENYERNRLITEQIYNNLADRMIANQQASAGRDAAAAAASDQRYADLQSSIANTYDTTQNSMADLLVRKGAGDAALASIMPRGAQVSADAQARAGQAGADVASYINNQNLASQDYFGSMSNAAVNQGVWSQEDLMRAQANMLNDWDIRNQNIKSQEAQQAIALGQQMTDRDLNLQNMNYGATQDAYQNAFNAAQGTNQNALSMYGLRNDAAQNSFANQLALANYNTGASQQNFQNQMALQEAALRAQQQEWDNAYKQAGLELERNSQLARANQLPAPEKPNNSLSKWDAAMAQTGSTDAKSFILDLVNTGYDQFIIKGNGIEFANQAREQATKARGPEFGQIAYQAALAYYETVWKAMQQPKR